MNARKVSLILLTIILLAIAGIASTEAQSKMKYGCKLFDNRKLLTFKFGFDSPKHVFVSMTLDELNNDPFSDTSDWTDNTQKTTDEFYLHLQLKNHAAIAQIFMDDGTNYRIHIDLLGFCDDQPPTPPMTNTPIPPATLTPTETPGA